MTDFTQESAHVGALLDIGHRLARLNKIANEADSYKFGEGFHDMPIQTQANAGKVAGMLLKQQPMSWYTVLQANLLMTQTASPELLRSAVTQVAAVAAAWLADIDERTPTA